MTTALSEPAELNELVDYQPDAVISRVVFRNPGGTLTVFAFDEGQGLTEHSNPNDATLLLLGLAIYFNAMWGRIRPGAWRPRAVRRSNIGR